MSQTVTPIHVLKINSLSFFFYSLNKMCIALKNIKSLTTKKKIEIKFRHA